MRGDACLLQTMTFARPAGSPIHLCTRIGEGKRAWHVKYTYAGGAAVYVDDVDIRLPPYPMVVATDKVGRH